MNQTVKDVIDFVNDHDVKFIRLAFCDIFGIQKNISIMASELCYAFEEGISFDGCSIDGFESITNSDLFLYPDPQTLSLLPWRPQEGRVMRFFCDIKNADKTQFSCDTRGILKRVVEECEDLGFSCNIGAECEFYLFKMDENGEPTNIPLDRAGYLDIAPLDNGENVRREICLCLEEMGIQPEASHHEQGPGQNEIDFRFSDPLTSADNLLTFKMVVKTIAARNGLFASLDPKPIKNVSGNGLHINVSLYKDGQNIFTNAPDHSKIAESFIAGILNRIVEITAFLNPVNNSYKRFGCFEAPQYVSWSHQNRSQLIRIPAATGEKVRMELRSPDPIANPYLAYALILSAGIRGIKNNEHLPLALDIDLTDENKVLEHLDKLDKLPTSLQEALDIAEKSDFAREVLGENIFNRYISLKRKDI